MDSERALVDYLNSAGLGATAHYDVPNPRPASLVVVDLTGGARGEGGTSTPTLDVQCWAPTRREARLLAARVEDALGDMPDHVESVSFAEVMSTFRDRDLESNTPRYHVVCTIYANE